MKTKTNHSYRMQPEWNCMKQNISQGENPAGRIVFLSDVALIKRCIRPLLPYRYLS
ncbi:MAG: hypothetical protein M3R17_14840 [Bacteroidota bacterium]|nr:hypothetical protein [Bacteroidota bacterium]